MTWICDNYATIIVGIAVCAIIIASAAATIKNRKKGKSGCAGNCAGCVCDCKNRK